MHRTNSVDGVIVIEVVLVAVAFAVLNFFVGLEMNLQYKSTVKGFHAQVAGM